MLEGGAVAGAGAEGEVAPYFEVEGGFEVVVDVGDCVAEDTFGFEDSGVEGEG
jgi:hypothetical protein